MVPLTVFPMLVLPLIYLGLLGALAWGIYYHAVHNWSLIMHLGGFTGGGKVVIFKFLIYLVPLLAGLVVLFFMHVIHSSVATRAVIVVTVFWLVGVLLALTFSDYASRDAVPLAPGH